VLLLVLSFDCGWIICWAFQVTVRHHHHHHAQYPNRHVARIPFSRNYNNKHIRLMREDDDRNTGDSRSTTMSAFKMRDGSHLWGWIQTSLLYSFWSLMTKIGIRRIGHWIQKWYASAYDTSIFYCHRRHPSQRLVALTIDDGFVRPNHTNNNNYGDQTTTTPNTTTNNDNNSINSDKSMILPLCDLLRSYQAHGTFFVCTDYTTSEQAQFILSEGHELGNHLKEDRSGYYAFLNEEEFTKELDETNTILDSFLIHHHQQQQNPVGQPQEQQHQ